MTQAKQDNSTPAGAASAGKGSGEVSQGPVQNTDRELWREREGDYYAHSIHVTAHGGIGINVGGHVIVKPLSAWHELARAAIAKATQ